MKSIILTIVVLGFVCFTSIFPSCGVSTASLSDVKLCSAMNGNDCSADASSFNGDIPAVYCTANLKNAPSQTKVTFDWKHGGESMGKAEVLAGSGSINSTFRPSAPLEPGKYSVTVKIDSDNSTPVTKEFSIE